MSDTAYLCVWLQSTTVTGIGIYSAPPWGVTTRNNGVPALIWQMQDDSFATAQARMLTMLKSLPDQHPVKALAVAFQLIPSPRDEALVQVLSQVRGRLEGMQKYISDRNLGEQAEDQFMLNERALRRIDEVLPSCPQDKAPCCPKCGDNAQVWKNQITGKLTCHRAGCHTEIP